MIKKIILGILLMGISGGMVYGAVDRTIEKAQNVNLKKPLLINMDIVKISAMTKIGEIAKGRINMKNVLELDALIKIGIRPVALGKSCQKVKLI